MNIRIFCKLLAPSLFSALLLNAAPTLQITSPLSGTVVSPGQTLPVSITPSGSFTQVVVMGQDPIGPSAVVGTASNPTGPYQCTLTIPATLSPGMYTLTALGTSSSGSATSTPITISVERSDSPVEITVMPSSLYLPVGQRTPLRVMGTYSDGTQLDITHSVSTSIVSTSNNATVDSMGYINAVAPTGGSVAHIVVNNSMNIPIVVPPSIAITPQYPVVYASQRAQFSVYEPGMGPVAVNWSLPAKSPGSISNSGVYTAPNSISAQALVQVTATLRSNPSQSISTDVVLFPPVSVSLSGPSTVVAGTTVDFEQNVLNALDNNVVWSISPKNVGSIDITGRYTAPATIGSVKTVTVTATSIADPTKSASMTVTLQQ